MPKRNVILEKGEFYHIYNRGVNGTTIFYSKRNYQFFLRRIREIITPEFASLICYALMPTHFHLLVQLNSDEFSSSMARLAISYTKAINTEQERSGPLFEGRFKAIHIDSDEYVLALSRYIHLNPVAAKIVSSPEQWPFSSYLDHIGKRKGTLPDKTFLLSYFSSPTPGKAYQAFVEAESNETDSNIDHLIIDND
jgi:REP element-mobilizing transposase RayT